MTADQHDSIDVVLIDDHAIVREGLSSMLSDIPGINVVASAANAHEGVACIETHLPRVVLLDLRLPDAHGLQILPEIVEHHPECRVVVLTIQDDVETAARALHAGAAGYVLKDASEEELVSAIRLAAQGRRYVSAELASSLITRSLDTRDIPHVTSREREILRFMAEGMTNKDIADVLFLSTETVKSHVSAILKKLDASDRAQAVSKSIRSGIIA